VATSGDRNLAVDTRPPDHRARGQPPERRLRHARPKTHPWQRTCRSNPAWHRSAPSRMN